jgi:hypothetical protein
VCGSRFEDSHESGQHIPGDSAGDPENRLVLKYSEDLETILEYMGIRNVTLSSL